MKKFAVFILALGFLFASASLASAQSACAFSLYSSRLFGYSSGSGQIQGTFLLKTTCPSDLAKVAFYIDGQVMGEATQAPFQWRYTTDSYSVGVHTLKAVGTTLSGQQLESNEIRAEFVSAETGWKFALKIMLPLLAVIFVAMLVSVLSTVATSSKNQHLAPGAPRSYGIAGGAICSRCKRPFSRHFMAINLFGGKLERCPYCGKWGVYRARSSQDLRLAEAAELQEAQTAGLTPQAGEQDDLRRELDNSRYQDL